MTAEIPALNLRQLTVVSQLGRGARGVVFLVRNDSSSGSELFALKTILRADCDGNECKQVSFEQEVLQLLQHPLLPKLHGVLSTDKIVAFAIDYCPGRDLHHLRKKQTEKMFSDAVIRFYAAELVIALEYLHKLGIVYRDLKPDNVMIQENGHLMLVDFDLSTKLSQKPRSESQSTQITPFLKSDQSMKNTNQCSVHPESVSNSEPSSETHLISKSNSFVGTEEYIAPEMIQNSGHGFSVDWWCLGVVLYEMLYGTTPFKGRNRKETFSNIVSKSPELVGEATALRDLIRKLLVKDRKRRISVTEIKGHEFFRGVDWEKVMEVCRPPFVPGPLDQEGMVVNKVDIEAYAQKLFEVDANASSKRWESLRNFDGN